MIRSKVNLPDRRRCKFPSEVAVQPQRSQSEVATMGSNLVPKTARPNERSASQLWQVLQQLPDRERDNFMSRCKEQRFTKGAHLFSQDTPYTTSYIIKEGVVRTYYLSPEGKEIIIAYWSDSALVGGPTVFREGSEHVWSAQAVTDTVALSIRGHDLEILAMEMPTIAHCLIETLSFKLHWVSVLLQTFGTESVRGRLAHLLLQLGEHYGTHCREGVMINYHFSHEELARMVGATRPWISRTLSSLKDESLVACNGRTLILMDREALRRMTHHPNAS